MTVNQPAECWFEYVSWGDPNAAARVETVFPAQSGTRALVLDSWQNFALGDSLYTISPKFIDLPDSNKQIEFWANTEDIANSLIISTADRQGPNANFTAIDTVFLGSARCLDKSYNIDRYS